MSIDFLENDVIYKGEKYCFMDLEVALTYCLFLEFPFLVPLSEENFVLIEHSKEKMYEALKSYQQKGLKSILLKEEHYVALLLKIRVKLQQEFQKHKDGTADPKAQKNLVEDFEKFHPIVHDALANVGITPATIDVAKAISEHVVIVCQSNESLVDLLSSFRSRCQSEYVKSMCVSYLVSSMMDKCTWNTRAIQEKVVLASLLSDASLKRQDFPVIERYLKDRTSRISERILNHPLETAKKLREQGVDAAETLTVIEEHHEMPDGSGFPRKLTTQNIAPLSTIHIVARHFVEQIMKQSHDTPLDLDKIFDQIYGTFREGNFKHACAALFAVLGKKPEISQA